MRGVGTGRGGDGLGGVGKAEVGMQGKGGLYVLGFQVPPAVQLREGNTEGREVQVRFLLQ
jgi:hypothetical protein